MSRVGCCRAAETEPRRSHGIRGGGAPAHIVPVAGVDYGLNDLAQKEPGALGCLPRVEIG